MIPNINENPRNRKRPKRGRKRFFNAAIHALRMRVGVPAVLEQKTTIWCKHCIHYPSTHTNLL